MYSIHTQENPACYLQTVAMAAVANPEQGLDADERIAIVDETNNEVVGSARRAEMVRAILRALCLHMYVHGGYDGTHVREGCLNVSTTAA